MNQKYRIESYDRGRQITTIFQQVPRLQIPTITDNQPFECMVLSCACFGPRHSPTHTINSAHLTQQKQVQLLTSLAMTRFGLRIEPITSLTPGGCATNYSRDAVLESQTCIMSCCYHNMPQITVSAIRYGRTDSQIEKTHF